MGVSPLLADLVRHAAAARGVALAPSAGTAADLVILGPGAKPLPPGPLPVLAISADLGQITGPNPADSVPFTPQNLGALLHRIAGTV